MPNKGAKGVGLLVDARIGGYVADFLWRPQRLVVETDGHAAHSGRESIEYDRRREAQPAAAGYEILRFTWRQVLHEPAEVIAALRARLAQARGDADPSR